MRRRWSALFNPDLWRRFVDRLPETATTVFVLTDSYTEFAQVAGELPGHLDVVRLYESYLASFVIGHR